MGPDRPMMSAHLALALSRDLCGRHHHAQVHHLKVVAPQHHADDVLADVVHVALDGGHDDLALGPVRRRAEPGAFSSSMKGSRWATACFITRAPTDHLGQEHLAGAEQVADHVHASHQRAFDHVQRASAAWPRWQR